MRGYVRITERIKRRHPFEIRRLHEVGDAPMLRSGTGINESTSVVTSGLRATSGVDGVRASEGTSPARRKALIPSRLGLDRTCNEGISSSLGKGPLTSISSHKTGLVISEEESTPSARWLSKGSMNLASHPRAMNEGAIDPLSQILGEMSVILPRVSTLELGRETAALGIAASDIDARR